MVGVVYDIYLCFALLGFGVLINDRGSLKRPESKLGAISSAMLIDKIALPVF